jgi:hypothetical protein
MKRLFRILLLALFVLLVLFALGNWHEIGHTLLARLLGDPESTYYFYRVYPEGGFCLGCNVYDEDKLSPLGHILVAAGGVLFTQLVAVTLLVLIRPRVMRPFLRRLTNITIILFALDLPFQVIQGLIRNPARHTTLSGVELSGVDMVDFMNVMAGQTGISVFAVKAASVVVTAMYLIWLVQAYRSRPSLAQALEGISIV